MKNYCFAFLSLVFTSQAMAQSQYVVSGEVYDLDGQPLSGSTLVLSAHGFMADEKGRFVSPEVSEGIHRLQVSFVGYETVDTLLNVKSDLVLHFHLKEDATLLDQVVIRTSEESTIYNTETVSQRDLMENFAGSFAKTLEKLPGVNSMDIGSGASKPIIRGLGFNRVAVSENGVKQEGQQWGADHGLEMDALNTEEAEVIKGVGTIEYGSDAMGGVIQINNEKVPGVHSFAGGVTTYAKTVNEAVGVAAHLKARGDRFFYKLKASAQDYADYRVPTDRINYLNTVIPIHNRRMKNTAGQEMNWYGQFGYVGKRIQNILSVSNVYSKSGFFPGSHGIPIAANVEDDGNRRNVEYPRQNVNHFKVTNSSAWFFDDGDKLNLNLAFQNNRRQEWSAFHSHYGNQSAPEKDPNLELDFDLNTFDVALKYEHLSHQNHKTTFGVQQNYQNNTIRGYGFLLPKYHRWSLGAFGIHEHYVSERFSYQAGARLDYASLRVSPYYDAILYDFLVAKGEPNELAQRYAQRSREIEKEYTSFNAMVGGKYELSETLYFSATVGTNFRFPTAIELGANGLHHGAFRHEKGNPDLNPERGWAVDVKAAFEKGGFQTEVSPYLYYFTNYIFLKPTGVFSILPDGGQIYEYTQSEALISGLEWKVAQKLWERWRAEVIFEYIYNKQITGNAKTEYPLPFTPPMNVFGELKYSFEDGRNFKETEIYIHTRWMDAQNRIAQGEEFTPSSTVFGAGVQSTIRIGGFGVIAGLQVTNVFDTKVLNHASYYRPLEIPELGRSLQLMVQIPF